MQMFTTPPEVSRRGFAKKEQNRPFGFAKKTGYPFDRCGKLIVAASEAEVEPLKALAQRCVQNEIAIEYLDAAELARAEPHIRAIAGFLVRATGITNYLEIASTMQRKITGKGGEVQLDTEVVEIREDSDFVHLLTNSGADASQSQWGCKSQIYMKAAAEPVGMTINSGGVRIHERHGCQEQAPMMEKTMLWLQAGEVFNTAAPDRNVSYRSDRESSISHPAAV